MSHPPSVEKVRVRIDPAIHEQARHIAQGKGMAVGDYLEMLVRQDGDADVRRAQQLAAAKGDRAVQRLEAIHANIDTLGDQFRHTVDALRTDLPKALDAGFAGMRSHISNTGGTAHLRDMIAKAEARAEARDKAMQSAITLQLRNDHETLRDKLDRENRVRRREAERRGIHIAFGAGIVLLLLLLPAFLLPNTAPTRWIAVRLVGATNQFHAASNLLQGDSESGLLLLKTQALLNDQKRFRSDYRACIERVGRASARFTCTMRFDPLLRAKAGNGS